MIRQRLTAQRLAAWFVAGWLLLGWPLLALWDHPVQVAGLPLLPLALFAVWAGLIAAVAWVLERDPAAAAAPADGLPGTPGR
ncbi:hypothetical protein AACH10_20300 [Ideonella sp. DXS22W]|uniref:DUF3311 domain-containing protein n=1 Tax=Pseudaquabacterium inlustre TaxID=2984192 RepID=A0ABU9CLB4_9BURK